jgi:hypothetical protein
MPEPLSLDDLLARIVEFVGEDEQRATQLGKALIRNEATKPVTRLLKQRGFNDASQALTKAQGRATELEAQVNLLTEQIEEKDAALTQLQSAQPDFAKRLRDTETSFQKRVRELEEEAKAEREGRRGDRLATLQEKFYAKLAPHLADEDYARYTALPKYAQYITLDEQGNELIKEPGEGTPYDPTKGSALDQLVADALDEIPPKYKTVPPTDTGAGTQARQSAPQRPRTVEEVKEVRKRQGTYAM